MGLGNTLRGSILALTALFAGATVLATGTPARAEEQKDERLGYSFTYPRKWQKRPVGAAERWIVAKFESEREFEDADPKTNFWSRHRPWIDVVLIPIVPDAPRPAPDGKAEAAEPKPAAAPPWVDLKGYLEKTFQSRDGGFWFSKEEELKVGAYRCLQYELTFDKGERSYEGPKKMFAWAFHTDDAIYGFIGETLIKFEDKVRPDLLASFKTFKAFPRTGRLDTGDAPADGAAAGGAGNHEDLDEDGLQRLREQQTTKRLIKIKDSLGSDWSVKESEHFIAVTHSDAKHTKSVLDHCEALREWLDKNLGYVGSGYAGRIIVRICKDREEHEALMKTGGYGRDGVEVTTFKDRDGWSDWSMSSLNHGILEVWTEDKNRILGDQVPRWLASGLRSVVGKAKSKGRNIEFPPGLWGREEVGMARRAGTLLPARSFFTMRGEDLWKGYTGGFGTLSADEQCEYLVRFLLVGGGRKSAKYKNVMSDYIKAIVFIVDEEEAARAKVERAAKAAQPKTDAPQDEEALEEQKKAAEALRKARAEWFRSNEAEFLEKVNKRVFGTWTDKDWDALNSAYMKELGS